VLRVSDLMTARSVLWICAHAHGFLQRTAGATAGSSHTRPRGPQGAHAGEPGSKLRRILRLVQRAYFRRNRHGGPRHVGCSALAMSRLLVSTVLQPQVAAGRGSEEAKRSGVVPGTLHNQRLG
jgi:hypothetical protein